MKIIKNHSLKKFTSISIGGPARFFAIAKTESDLVSAIAFAKKNRLPWYAVGEGTNLIANDSGFAGVIVQNQISKIRYQRSK